VIHGIRQFTRLLKISAILSRYRLDEFLEATHLYRPMRLLRVIAPGGRRGVADAPRGERLRLALNEMGPIYVKFGQIMSTRRDMIPADIADELALLQDQVPPFPGEQAQAIIEKALEKPVTELFQSFELKPLASASIAQVHAATLHDGREVVVKVVRPGIRKQLRRDIDLLYAIANLAEKYSAAAQRIKPPEFVREFESFVFDELDMYREASNASLLRSNFEGSKDIYIPEIYWPYCREPVLVMERAITASTSTAWPGSASVSFTPRFSATTCSTPTCIRATSWWMSATRNTPATSPWISASWPALRRPTCTTSPRISWRCSTVITSV
jgi:ubiquinone biosynthesis protein